MQLSRIEVLSLATLMCLVVSTSFGALGNDVEVGMEVTASPDAFPLIIPAVQDGSEPAKIKVTIDGADGWVVVRRNPTVGWLNRWIYFYTGNHPGEAYTATFTGRVVKDPPLPTVGVGGAVSEPDNYTVDAEGTFLEPDYYILPPKQVVCVGQSATYTAYRNTDDPNPAVPEDSNWSLGEVDHPGADSSIEFSSNIPKVYTVGAHSSATPVLQDTAEMTILRVSITEPDGLPILGGEGNTYFRSNPSCFEWQYVHVDNEVVQYHTTQPIAGIVEPIPPASYYWYADKGSWIDRPTASPEYVPNNQTVPATMREVTLSLEALLMSGERYGRKERTLEVYRDHLERDYQNFGDGYSKSCGSELNETWVCSRYGIDITMPTTWNCHGSCVHAYSGEGNGNASAPPTTGFVVSDPYLVSPSGDFAWDEILAEMKRGDIVAMYAETWAPNDIMHSHTCLREASGTQEPVMYGANNRPGISSVQTPDGIDWTGSWKWFTCTTREYVTELNSYALTNPALPDPMITKIVVYKKMTEE